MSADADKMPEGAEARARDILAHVIGIPQGTAVALITANLCRAYAEGRRDMMQEVVDGIAAREAQK